MTAIRKLPAMLLCIFLLLSTVPASALQGPGLPQTINGGPIIDASIFGNRELYPGETTAIQVVIQNSGVLEGLIGYQTPKPYTISETLTLPLNSGQDDGKINNSSSGDTKNQTDPGNNNCTDKSPTATPAPAAVSTQSTDLSSLSSLSGLSGLSGGVLSTTTQITPLFNDLELNTGAGVDLAATTALGVTATLSTGTAPVEIVSGDCVVGGSLCAGSVSPPFTFILRVDRAARPGVYALPVTVTYKHLADQYDLKSAFGSIESINNYIQDCVTLYVYIVIREAFDLIVTVDSCNNMVPGSDGIVTMKVSNVGGVCAEESVVYLIPSLPGPPQDGSAPQTAALIGASLVLPVQSSQFIGRMDPGDERLLNFKVAISPDAEAGTYPLSALVSYTDAWGQQKSSNVETFGVPVLPEMKFSVDDSPIMIKGGQSDSALLNLTNIGSETARDAVVRMNALDPFVVSYDTAYLGDVKPGDNVSTTFGIKVKSDAVPTTYYVTLEVKYYDDNDDPHVTKIIRKAILVAPPPTILDMVVANWPLVAGLGIVAALGLVYAGRRFANGGKKPPRQEPPQQALLPDDRI
jgi:hypothetical protein